MQTFRLVADTQRRWRAPLVFLSGHRRSEKFRVREVPREDRDLETHVSTRRAGFRIECPPKVVDHQKATV